MIFVQLSVIIWYHCKISIEQWEGCCGYKSKVTHAMFIDKINYQYND